MMKSVVPIFCFCAVGFSCSLLFQIQVIRTSQFIMAEAKDERRRVPVGTRLEGRWEVSKILGEGAFGAVYEVTDTDRPGKVFALKVESNADDPEGPPKMLPLEVTVLRALRNIGAKFYPGYESCGQNDKFNYVVMGLVGKNIDSLRKTLPNKRFTLRSCLHIGIRSILSLEEIHRAGYLHRDLKPANMCIGRGPNDLRSVYILDWGLCRQYVNSTTGKPHRPRVRAGFRGTPRYASANALNDIDQGRVDDMWSWFFGIIELTVGLLPWDSDQNAPNEMTAYMRWLGKKKQECVQDMSLACQGCPKEFGNIYTALVRMQFVDKPDYDYFIACQKDVMARKNFREESALDWEPHNELAKMTQVVPNATMMHNENRKRSY